MRSRAERLKAPLLLGLGLAILAVPGLARDKVLPLSTSGPEADYPVVLGPPFTVNGVTFTPADKLNFDQVGYAEIDPAAGSGVSIAHQTLPLPSYAEITSLRTGKTILVRVERRGPMTGDATISLSPGAAAQLGTADGRTPVRIRRVNPSEPERAMLRSGQRAPERMDTPMSLVAVLVRKLDPGASPSASPVPVPSSPKQPAVMPPTLKRAPAETPGAEPPAVKPSAPKTPAGATTIAAPTVRPVRVPVPAAAPAPAKGGLVIQVGAFASRASAAAVAAKVGGAVSPAGKLFRVRLGGFASPAQASAALAKVRAAGYSDARIQHAD